MKKKKMSFKDDVLPHYRWLLKNAPRLTGQQAYEIMRWSQENEYTTLMLWKIPNKTYQKWYNDVKNCVSTLEDETTYIVSSNNKAFGDYGSYSIFADSIGAKLRENIYEPLDRIEHIRCEFAIIITMFKNQQ